MLKIKIINKLKSIVMLCATLSIPAVLPADTSFASVSPVENKSEVVMADSLDASEQEVPFVSSEQLCVDSNFGRTRLKSLLHDQRRVVLTFDDGPHPNTTPHVLDILRKRNLKAVFFLLGVQAKKYPNIVKRIHDEGHIIGNHTYGHKNLSAMSPKEISNEIEKASSLLENITGERPKYLRPPYGASCKKVVNAVNEAGMKIVLWTVDTRDWSSKNEKAILKEIDKQLHLVKGNPIGGAILMHDIYPSTVRALDKILDKLATSEYKVTALNNLGNTESEFWSAKYPVMSKEFEPITHADPEICQNPYMISLLKERPKTKPSHIAMLKAKREGALLLFLAQADTY